MAAFLLSARGCVLTLLFVTSTSLLHKQFRTPTVLNSFDMGIQPASIYRNLTLELSRQFEVPYPSYVQIVNEGILSVTSFSLLRKGSITQFSYDDFSKSTSINGEYFWPNEISSYRDALNQLVILIPDGFLMPGQNDGALYAIRNPNKKKSTPVRITARKPGWFYHRAVYVELSNGHKGILTARAHKPLFGEGKGELVWLSVPESSQEWWDSSDPWQETVLVNGPDVMFEIVDKDAEGLSLVAAHFFGKKLSMHTLAATDNFPYVRVVESMEVDTIGRPYGLCLTTMPSATVAGDATVVDSTTRRRYTGNRRRDRTAAAPPLDNRFYSEQVNTAAIVGSSHAAALDSTHILVSTHECAYDFPKALRMAWCALRGQYPRINTGDSGFRVGEQSVVERRKPADEDGGSLFAYEIPRSSPGTRPQLQPDAWQRHTLFRGFKVRGWGGIFSPGAPGFPYVFKLPHRPHAPPMILLAGDCTGSAYIFSPSSEYFVSRSQSAGGQGECPLPQYELAFEIECGATVGSAAVRAVKDGSGDVEIFVPSYELSQVNIFRLGTVPET